MEVRIEENTEEVRSDLGRIMTKIPEVERELTEEMMEIAVQEIKKSAEKKFNNFTGNLQNQIDMRNVKEQPTGDGVQMKLQLSGNTPRDVDYIEWHERADSGHFVSVDRENEPIQKWVDRYMTEDPNFLYVEPTPFVKPAVQRIARRAREKARSDDNAVAELAREFE